MALTTPSPKLAADLATHYQFLLTCPDREPAHVLGVLANLGLPVVDTLAHLPLFHSLPGHILEIGCDCGNSTTAFLAGAAATVTSIDLNPLCTENFPDSPRWRFVLGDSHSEDVFDKVCNQQYDVLYVDGDHSYEGALADLQTYSKLVRTGGLILVHDVLATDNFPGVWRAFADFDRGANPIWASAKYVLPGSYGLGVVEL